MSDTLTLLRQRFHELRQEIAAVEAASAPLREQRDAIHGQARAIEASAAPLNDEIRVAETGLYEKKLGLAQLSRALDGKTAVGGKTPVGGKTATSGKTAIE